MQPGHRSKRRDKRGYRSRGECQGDSGQEEGERRSIWSAQDSFRDTCVSALLACVSLWVSPAPLVSPAHPPIAQIKKGAGS